MAKAHPAAALAQAKYVDFRVGDIRHSLADIGAARTGLGYAPTFDVARGLDAAIDWYLAN